MVCNNTLNVGVASYDTNKNKLLHYIFVLNTNDLAVSTMVSITGPIHALPISRGYRRGHVTTKRKASP